MPPDSPPKILGIRDNGCCHKFVGTASCVKCGWVPCKRCRGLGEVRRYVPCEQCAGTGDADRSPDAEGEKL